jgi:CHAT domain-containing protein
VAQIPSDTAVVFYAYVQPALHAWVLTGAGITHVPVADDAAPIDAAVERLWTLLQSRTGDTRPLLADLHRRLLGPVEKAIGGRRQIVVIPDRRLFDVPFAALYDERRTRYLVEDATVAVSPSLTLMQFGDESPPDLSRLAVGIFGGNRIGSTYLPELEAEQAAIKAIYSTASVTRHTEGKAEFLRTVDRYDIVHFAGHAVANVADPALSRLEFGSADELPSGDLLASELTQAHLRRVRLVVLAACRTGWGRQAPGEGALSLAHAFLAAGTRGVVGSLWDVEDAATRFVLSAMHRHMAGGAPVRAALREAQLEALASSDPSLQLPSSWAAFIVNISGATAPPEE